MILIDTCVLIDYFKENDQIVEKIKKIKPSRLMVNSIIVMELFVGARNKNELNAIKKRLNGFCLLEINQIILNQATMLMEKHSLAKGLKIADAIIAATAFYYQIPLFTFNKKDFGYLQGLNLF